MSLTDSKCPVCELYYSFNIKEIIKKDNINYFFSVCHNCGYVMQTPHYNKTAHHSLGYERPMDYALHAKNRANYIIDYIRTYHTIVPVKKYEILDVGSGEGLVGYHISKNLNCNVTGVTLHPEKFEFIPTYNVDLENILNQENILSDMKFDIIIMSHVLEHFFEPQKVLSYLSTLLKRGGIIYIEVPSFYKAEVRSKKVFVPEHISFFTKISLKNLIISSDLIPKIMTESKYWGNIKCLAIYNPNLFFITYDKFVYTKYVLNKFFNKIRKILYKNKRIDPNG